MKVSSYTLILYIFGILSAIRAVLNARTSEGAIAWAISLISWPSISLPLYWIFGRRKFEGHVNARRSGTLEIHQVALRCKEQLIQHELASPFVSAQKELKVFETLAMLPFTGFNHLTLLINGHQTFESIFESILKAEHYILIQFYIVRDDFVGRKLQRHLLEMASKGVKIYFLYDDIGSYELPKSYNQAVTHPNIQIYPFSIQNRKKIPRMHINFRNHRKIVVVDGHIGFIGGHNVGQEYLGHSKEFGQWRDTHLKLEGPSVQCLQVSFLEDWYWVTQQIPTWNWNARRLPPSPSTGEVLIIPSGPADDFETGSLYHIHLIHIARFQLWISTPYFVPDRQTTTALQLACFRGVDVCIILPERIDNRMAHFASRSYWASLTKAGVKIYTYRKGFIHQKVLLIDGLYSSIGTSNIDQRSFRLNFEISAFIKDVEMAKKVEEMLIDDKQNSKLIKQRDMEEIPFHYKFLFRFARLFSPIL